MKQLLANTTAFCFASLLLFAGCAEKKAAAPEIPPPAASATEASIPGGETIQIDLRQMGSQNKSWIIENVKQFGGKELLRGRGQTSPRSPFQVKYAGPHRFSIAFYTEENKAGNFIAVIRNPQGEAIHCEKVDTPYPACHSPKPYLPYVITRPAGAQICKFDCTFEFPGVYTIEFRGNFARRSTHQNGIYIDSVYATPLRPTALIPKAAPGFVEAPVLPLSTDLYCGIKDYRKRFRARLGQNGQVYSDIANIVSLGATSDYGRSGEDYERYNLASMGGVEVGLRVSPEFRKAHPSPEGRFVNAEGQVGSGYSFGYDPAVQENERLNKLAFEAAPEKPAGYHNDLSVAGETGGRMDYAPCMQEKFRAWLKAKYKTIEGLNKAWRTKYGDFAEIQAARSVEESKACYLEYRDFCGKIFAQAVDRSIEQRLKWSKTKLPLTSNFSNVDFGAAGFFRYRPVDIEEIALDGMKRSDTFGWDAYCTDDFMGLETDFAHSFSRGKRLMQEEHNVHTQDWRIAVRTYWTMVGKDVKGVNLFQLQGASEIADHAKWAFYDMDDMTPANKMFANSDAMQEIHRIEDILMSAKKVYQKKPVALYFSRIDKQFEEPIASSFSEGLDSQYRVYEMLRERGYDVTAITPRQIRDGFLNRVAAVVFVNVQHIAPDVVKKLMDWTSKQGGVLIADTWPGAYNDLGFRQDDLMTFFGIKPKPPKAKVDKVKLEESVQGYGEMTLAAINPSTVTHNLAEIFQQYGSTHPIIKGTGKFMFNGYGYEPVECIGGEVVAVEADDAPGAVVNRQGKGHTLYFSVMLGSLYGGSCTAYERTDTHSGNGAQRLIDEFLKFAGVEKAAVISGIPERVRAKLRVEVPMFDAAGNAIIGLTSFNDDVVRPFRLEIAWTGRPAPKKLFAAVGGSRELKEIPFKFENGRLSFDMVSFDTHATLLALQNARPIVSLEFPDAKRGEVHLVEMLPSQEEKVVVTVHNPSGTALEKGLVELRLPQGWYCDSAFREVAPIPAFGSVRTEFRIKAPAFCSHMRARPVTFVYRSGKTESMPATEVIRWKTDAK